MRRLAFLALLVGCFWAPAAHCADQDAQGSSGSTGVGSAVQAKPDVSASDGKPAGQVSPGTSASQGSSTRTSPLASTRTPIMRAAKKPTVTIKRRR